MASKFGSSLSGSQVRFARKVEAAGLASYSRAIKVLSDPESYPDELQAWETKLDEKAPR